MEYTNLHSQSKVEEQYVKYTSLLTQTGHRVSTVDEWKPNLLPNIGSRYHRNPVQTVLKSKDLWPSMNEDSSFNQQPAANEYLLANIKDEMSDSFPKLSEMMYCNTSTEDSYLLSKKPESGGQDLGGNLWYSNMTERQLSTRDLYTNANDHYIYDFNHIFPSTNISTLDSYLVSITSTKRPVSFSDTKEPHIDAKKHRSSTARSPCPTLKVRKEKLGDRVAALQKLVAPFGKTDTASVLTEAIGYIQFLHDQVETLSVPFMKSSQSKLYRTRQMSCYENNYRELKLTAFSSHRQGLKEEEQKPDLRSRGLCLVPESFAEYFINRCFNGI
ncbi:transcription factor bHLH110-like protein [Gossypium australe]|uniref:Transcription factor bHLH110-like protein n=1 Tax=Gossypium australe TaxID=47621 RepID=A0A5B6UN32_9ROSI|nr:transcription factor bHLH110-like protein [Gossypium australe]